MAVTAPFQWSPSGEAMTPQQVARQREIALALSGQAGSTAPVAHWTQAVNRGLQGWLAGDAERYAARAEEEGMAGANAAISGNPVLSALLGGAPSGPQPAIMSSDGMGGGAFPASLIQSESGGNWGALNNEGYGGRLQFGEARLADAARAGIIPAGLTGADFSRMSPEQQQAVEAWHFADIDRQAAQMGLDQFIGQEVAGIPITQDGIRAMAHLGGIGGAARFLQSGGQHNPADSNGTSLADYARAHGGGVGASYAAPNQAVVSALMGASADPWVQEAYGPQIAALLGQQMDMQGAAYGAQLAQQDPMYQAQLEAMQMENAAMRNPSAPAPVFEGGQWWDLSTGAPQALTQNAVDPTASMQNYEALIGQGVPPEEARVMAFGNNGTTVNVGGADDFGPIPAGWGLTRGPDGEINGMAPIPGGPAAAEVDANAAGADMRAAQTAATADIVVQDIDAALALASGSTTGAIGALLQNIPGTNARDLDALLSTIRANIGFDRLQQMRDASPTGGALGAISDRETATLQAVLGNLEQSQSEAQLRRNLERARETYLDIIHGPGNRPEDVAPDQPASPASGAPPPSFMDSGFAEGLPAGVTPQSVWDAMTPEDRALWGN